MSKRVQKSGELDRRKFTEMRIEQTAGWSRRFRRGALSARQTPALKSDRGGYGRGSWSQKERKGTRVTRTEGSARYIVRPQVWGGWWFGGGFFVWGGGGGWGVVRRQFRRATHEAMEVQGKMPQEQRGGTRNLREKGKREERWLRRHGTRGRKGPMTGVEGSRTAGRNRRRARPRGQEGFQGYGLRGVWSKEEQTQRRRKKRGSRKNAQNIW